MSGHAADGGSAPVASGCSIVIVTFRSNPCIDACLDSIAACGVPAVEVVVVDNGGTSIPATSLDLVVHRLPENLGFGRAVNLGVKLAKYDTILLLNPDTELFVDTLPAALARLHATDHPTIFGAISYNKDGGIHLGFKGPLPSLSHLLLLALGAYRWYRPCSDELSLCPDEHLAGCFLLMYRSTWLQLGGFDPRYFMYFEDADLCMRARALGIDCVVATDVEIRHDGGRIPRDDAWKIDCFARNGMRYLSQHASIPSRQVGFLLLMLWWMRRRFMAAIHHLLVKLGAIGDRQS